VATLSVLQSVARNVELPSVAVLSVATLSAKVQSAVIRYAVTPNEAIRAAVPNGAVLNVATLSLVRNAVIRDVVPDVVPNVVFRCAAIQSWFQVVIRVAPNAALVAVPYAVRCVVVNPASRVHGALRGDLPDDSHVSAP
jgi:hypothetical protein